MRGAGKRAGRPGDAPDASAFRARLGRVQPPADPRDKAAWRRAARAARAGVDRDTWSAAVEDVLRAWTAYRSAGTVAAYLAFGSEADLAGLFEDDAARAAGRRIVLPRVAAREGLTLHPFDAPRERHRFGMEEPLATAPRVPPDAVDLILVPGLAFDLRGARLGYGGGHYDRLLPTLRPEVARVGVAHPALQVERLPREPHDALLTHLVLPDGVIDLRAGDTGP
ncbi:MAG: 5-formyltetrahydrofolate cyclo-ligase [Deinococcus-Thermus bacterium]|nr:5-formyltetrahydrofolate cyclo-ligase [Deinococcota bacterium]